MFFISLVVSLILVALSHVAARPAPNDVRWGPFVVASLLLLPGLMLIQLFLTATLITCVLLAISLKSWPRLRARVPTFLPFSIGSLAIAYAFGFLIAIQEDHKFDDLRSQYPLESMEERVREPEPAPALAAPSVDRLAKLERELQSESNSLRTSMLRRLHDQSVEKFVNSPGFGVTRMIRPSENWLRPRDRGEPGVQSGWPSTDPSELSISASDESDLFGLHEALTLDFVNAAGFGYVKDRRHVAGFLPHGFGYEREVKTTWEAGRIELVGLLLHSEPVVYVSSRRPVMQELRDGPTRPLDAFEMKALASIRSGNDLVPASAGDGLRMVGAIRSARQCVECHGGQRGDLLGAFSYMLRRGEAKRQRLFEQFSQFALSLGRPRNSG